MKCLHCPYLSTQLNVYFLYADLPLSVYLKLITWLFYFTGEDVCVKVTLPLAIDLFPHDLAI